MNKPDIAVALTKCPICGRDNDLIFNRVLTKKHADEIRKMHGKAVAGHICPACQEYMRQGIILIGVRDGESGNNPYRTGNFAVVKEEGVKQFMSSEVFEKVVKTRVCFIEDSVWDAIGLPKENVNV